ncbi:Bifunctional inhibitor/plant lipid transfer protein/seed storage helical domain [Macleaya cordata]|uniref:Bifunctional inhibitor/plant lipid transfer protein/seed storage helical domain n=1 Tax=Macleaya cordata TaxID=56857 RepID=A0A200Q7D0_MACCD|nr:Bifunctional inhibitor/plant lipid transfer protein/seed storage helical domain [Macleaya cordata]
MVIVVVGVLITSRVNVGACPSSKADKDFIKYCEAYIGPKEPKSAPSKECCDASKKADLPCFCKLALGKAHGIWVREKIVLLAAFCDTPLQQGTKCGNN